ncbi:hypothetical protein PR003_g24703 [Phytophthora rubi]|uniref:DUF6818 domain-containing protein n=1 Tax=Phytophthora rubi TaxID=129364 RepID=A0A6A4CLK2_9STRA|nr:hypothetical protein PR002_g24353 [Phytophthora rubi]KAE9292663.1 hypothetical protein PR003_g24703 [Phytophthora rubi]
MRIMAPSKSKSGRGEGWAVPELNRILTAVDTVLPLESDAWDMVAARYDTELPSNFTNRDVDAIERKLMLLKNSMKPTCDPACPEEVVRVKCAYYLMESRGDAEPTDYTTTATMASTEVGDTVATAEPPEKVTTPSEGVTAPHPRYFHRIKVCLKPPRRLGQNRSGVTSRQSSLHSCV